MSCFRSGVNIALLLFFFFQCLNQKKNHLKKKELNKKILLLFLFVFHPINNALAIMLCYSLLTCWHSPGSLNPRYKKPGSPWTTECDEAWGTTGGHSAMLRNPVFLTLFHSALDLRTAHIKAALWLHVSRWTDSWQPKGGHTPKGVQGLPSWGPHSLTSPIFKDSLSHVYAPAQLD